MKHQKPNIVFIVLDTHRVDRLGCYGYQRNTSPNIDAFAQNATLFENAISPAQWTIPSHASMFCGEYPTTHLTIQASDALSKNFKTAAEYLLETDYKTIGLCNNPLVGVLNNGFRRGFEKFYNYGGTIPSTPSSNGHNSNGLLAKIRGQYQKTIDWIATPIQQAVAASPEIFQLVLNPWLVPLWTCDVNFKGDTKTSIQDTTQIIQQDSFLGGDDPNFIFLNLMETHLPYTPSRKFVRKFAPIILEDPDARSFMETYNTQALQWLLPLAKPYPELETKTINDMYDAEVAYQDHLLEQLLITLDKPEYRENTMVIIVSDHGEMLGEHQIMGHGLGVYKELIHVPMIIRFPGQEEGHRINEPVSTTQIFHTILEATNIETIQTPYGQLISTSEHSLRHPKTQNDLVFSEAYPADNLVKILEKNAPSLVDAFHCKATQWAVYNQPYKLMRVEGLQDVLINYHEDIRENNLIRTNTEKLTSMSNVLNDFISVAASKSQNGHHGSAIDMQDDQITERLRNLGYIE